MQVEGDYHKNGYAHLRGLIPAEVAHAFMSGLKQDMGPAPIPVSQIPTDAVLKRPAFEIYGHNYKPMTYFLWALTPTVSKLVGKDLLPTYDYFRIYREGDVCLVHSDRPSCEHSLSLTLDYSDGEVWDLEIARDRIETVQAIEEDFGSNGYSSVGMQIGDAVLYQGVHYRHGRTTPNPNGWSAHLVLHWVDRDGPYRNHAFDGQPHAERVNFKFT